MTSQLKGKLLIYENGRLNSYTTQFKMYGSMRIAILVSARRAREAWKQSFSYISD